MGRGGNTATQTKIPYGGVASITGNRPSIKSSKLNIDTAQIGTNVALGESLTAVESSISNINIHLRNVDGRVVAVTQKVATHDDILKWQNQQMSSFTDQIHTMNDGLAGVQEAAQQNLLLENQEKSLEEEQRKKDAQQAKRGLAGSALTGALAVGNKLKEGMMSKVSAIGDQAGGILERIKKFLLIVVGGWLANKTIDLINAKATGATDLVEKIKGDLLKGIALIGGTFLLVTGALGPLFAGIGGLLATLAGFLFTPWGLAALLIAAAGVGIAVGVDAIRTKMAGGKQFREAHKKNKEQLKELGVNPDGSLKGHGGFLGFGRKSVEEHGTEEQKEAFRKYEEEQKRIDAHRDKMREEMDAEKAKVRKARQEGRDKLTHGWHKRKGSIKEIEDYDKETKLLEQEAEKRVRAKYEKTLVSSSGSSANISPSIKDRSSDIGPEVEGQPTILPVEIPASGRSGPVGDFHHMNDVEKIPSGDDSNMYLVQSKAELGWTT